MWYKSHSTYCNPDIVIMYKYMLYIYVALITFNPNVDSNLLINLNIPSLTNILTSGLSTIANIFTDASSGIISITNTPNQAPITAANFAMKRKATVDKEATALLGSRMRLNADELLANKIILAKKFIELDKSNNPNEVFPPSINIYQAKELIAQSEIFNLIKRVPKGANLLCFLPTSANFEFIYELTFEDNLYIKSDNYLQYRYSNNPPGPDWYLLSDLRNGANSAEINQLVIASLTLNVPNPEINDVLFRRQFPPILYSYSDLLTYKPNLLKTFRRILEVFYEDQITYAEISYDFRELYDLDGNTYDASQILTFCAEILNDFKRTHTDFAGVRFIYIPNLRLGNDISVFRKTATALWTQNPNLIVGFVVGKPAQVFKPLSEWVDELSKFPKAMKLFYDVGLTFDWGTPEDTNLIDAIALNPAAIRESYSITRHPDVLEYLRQNRVPVDFSPYWAQTTRRVDDLRNHPAVVLVSTDTPMVIGSDGSSIWGITGLSYEWYGVYLAMTPRDADLRTLKQLAVNSWSYSNIPLADKEAYMLTWLTKWDAFIQYIITNYNT